MGADRITQGSLGTTGMVQVESAGIKAVGHDEATNTTHVQFHSGETIYPFGPMTRAEFERFRDAGSIGKHFHAHVRAKAIQQ